MQGGNHTGSNTKLKVKVNTSARKSVASGSKNSIPIRASSKENHPPDDSVRDALKGCKDEIRDLREIVLYSKRSKWRGVRASMYVFVCVKSFKEASLTIFCVKV